MRTHPQPPSNGYAARPLQSTEPKPPAEEAKEGGTPPPPSEGESKAGAGGSVSTGASGEGRPRAASRRVGPAENLGNFALKATACALTSFVLINWGDRMPRMATSWLYGGPYGGGSAPRCSLASCRAPRPARGMGPVGPAGIAVCLPQAGCHKLGLEGGAASPPASF